MNKRVFQAFLHSIWALLIAYAVVKVFFADMFALAIQNSKLIEVGRFVDSRLYLQFAIKIVLSFIVYHFYMSACKQVWHLKSYHYIILAWFAVAINVVYYFAPNAGMIIDIAFMLFYPCVMGCNYKQAVSVFMLHYLGQMAILRIRDMPLYLIEQNTITSLVLMIDVYIWLVLYYLYANKYKEISIWDSVVYRFSVIKESVNSVLKKLSSKRK